MHDLFSFVVLLGFVLMACIVMVRWSGSRRFRWIQVLMVNFTSGAMDLDNAPAGKMVRKSKKKHIKGRLRASAVFAGLKGSRRGKVQKKRK